MTVVTQVWQGPLFKYWGSTPWLQADGAYVYMLTGRTLEKRELHTGRVVWSVPSEDRVMVGCSHGVVITCRLYNRRIQVEYNRFSAFDAGDSRLLWRLNVEFRRPLWQGLDVRQQVLDMDSGPLVLLDKPRWLKTSELAADKTEAQLWVEWCEAIAQGRMTWRIGRDVLVQERTVLQFFEWPKTLPAWAAERLAGGWLAGADAMGFHGIQPERRCFTLDTKGRLLREVDYGSACISPVSGRLTGQFERWAEVPFYHALYDVAMVAGRYVVAETQPQPSLRVFGIVEDRVPLSLPGHPEFYLVGSGADGVLLLQSIGPDQGALYYVSALGE